MRRRHLRRRRARYLDGRRSSRSPRASEARLPSRLSGACRAPFSHSPSRRHRHETLSRPGPFGICESGRGPRLITQGCAHGLEAQRQAGARYGSTAGIGFAIALGLAREGAAVVVNGRTDGKVSEAIKRIAAETDAAVTGIAADLGTRQGVEQLLAKLGPVNILINNLGIFEPKPFLEISDADWFRFFETNVMSGVRLARQIAGLLASRNARGTCALLHRGGGVPLPLAVLASFACCDARSCGDWRRPELRL